MRLNFIKFELACARKCVKKKDLVNAGISRSTLARAAKGMQIRPETIGRIARVIKCEVEDLVDKEGMF